MQIVRRAQIDPNHNKPDRNDPVRTPDGINVLSILSKCLSLPARTQVYKWSTGEFNAGRQPCEGLASHPGVAEIHLVVS